jgi:hypothetical protein
MTAFLALHRGPAWLGVAVATVALAMLFAAPKASATSVAPGAFGGLDCNGHSTIQQPVKPTLACTDLRGSDVATPNTWNSRFYDNGYYIGHDEPDVSFLSSRPGSGNNVAFTETLPIDPNAAPTDRHPGHDVSNEFELDLAHWISMAICDPKSYPTNAGCPPESDSNAPTCVGANITNCSPGGGSAGEELQLYPPGFPPNSDGISCDDSHYCAALNIDSLECTLGFAVCNPACEEPVNYAFIQRDGVPAGPPGPQDMDLQTFTPNNETLLMNPGDTITIHLFDAPAPGGGRAFEVLIRDLTTGQSGFMQASAANGFMDTNGIVNGAGGPTPGDCSGTPFNFQPEYSTAAAGNIIGWAAVSTDIASAAETGHWEPCTSLAQPAVQDDYGFADPFFNECIGPYESGGDSSTGPEPVDGPCYPAGDTHSGLGPGIDPDTMTGCLDFIAGGDLDFDGTPYWPEWPTGDSRTHRLPSSGVWYEPTTNGAQYSQFYFQTDIGLSEATCAADSSSNTACSVPPPGSPGQFYPYWSLVDRNGVCAFEFGNVHSGPGVDDFGGDAGYGSNQFATLAYPEIIGPVHNNRCQSGH